MKISVCRLAGASLALVLAGCGDNDITPLETAATHTPSAIATSTRTLMPASPTATLPLAATATATLRAATATATATATDRPPATATPTGVATATATNSTASALYNADTSNPLNPFPSDRLRREDGHVQVPVGYFLTDLPQTPEFQTARAYASTVSSQLSSLTGFGTFAPIRVRFDRPMVIDPGLNPRGILLLNADDLDDAPVLITATTYEPENSIEIQPVVPLKPKTRYAYILTNTVVDANGLPAQASADFSKLLSGTGLDATQMAYRDELLPVLQYANQAYDIRQDQVVVADLFTTLPTTDDLIAIQQRLVSGDLTPGGPVFDQPLGSLQTGIFGEGTQQYRDIIGSNSSPNVAAVGIGFFESFDFRDRPNGSFEPSRVNGPAIPSTNRVDFYVTIPKAPKPPGGYPLAMFGHGLGGSGRDVGAIGRVDAQVPVMGIAISALQHGRRGSVTNFFVLNNVATTREYFRQTVADYLQVIRMIKNAKEDGIAPFDMVDTDHLWFLGGSLGGIMGTLFMATEPDVKVGMLSVPGGGLPNILASKDIGGLLEPLLALTTGIAPTSPQFRPFLHRFRQTSQWALESADPINYAPYMIVPGAQLPGVPLKRILMHEGIVDSVVPNRATDDLALAMRLPDLKLSRGCNDPMGCSGIWRFVMTDYGEDELSGHGVTLEIPAATRQAFDFLTSDGTVINDASPGQ